MRPLGTSEATLEDISNGSITTPREFMASRTIEMIPIRVITGELCSDRRGEGLCAGQGLRSLYFRLLVVVPEDSANHPFSHTVSVIPVIELCWSTRRALATNGNWGSLNVGLTAAISVP
jgi:hypothetical protein